jgi:aryl-alcohol dehydrogenase-like predicted oxidoreductase
MERRQIGDTDLSVSTLCFGTMLFGESPDEATAARLLAVAADSGINFWDSAEMYAIPQSAATQGRSEAILGAWMCGQRRQDHVVCTKVAGPGSMDWLRGGPTALDGKNITEAIDGSLRRLQTDYIDLVLLHWPDR